MPALELMPAAMVAEVERLRAHPAGRFGLRLYARERSRTAAARA
jgi:hypothetical protein